MKRKLVMTVICALAVGVVAPAASAQQEPAREGYRQAPIQPNLLQDLEGPPQSPAADEPPAAEETPGNETPAAEESEEASGDTLPFTGLDVAIVALMGVALVGTGAAMRRTVRRPEA